MSFVEVVMSKDKYLYKFSRKIEAIVFNILQIFCKACEKNFTNSSLYSARNVFFWMFSGTTE